MSTPGGPAGEVDPALARAWREASGDEPPPALDDAIRAAARRAVHAGPRPAGRSFVQRWRVPLSIAALLVVSASLTLMISERDAHLPTAVPPPASGDAARARTAPPAQTAQPGAPAAGKVAQQPLSAEAARALSGTPSAASADADARAVARNQAGERAARAEGEGPGAAPAAPAPAGESPAGAELPAAPAPTLRDESPAAREDAAPAGAGAPRAMESEPAAAEARQKRESGLEFDASGRESQNAGDAEPPAGRARLKMQARPSASPPLRDAEPLPEQWIEQIRELRRQGLVAQAEASLKQFRERYPDFALPADLDAPGDD